MAKQKWVFLVLLITLLTLTTISAEEFGYNLLSEPTFDNNTAFVNNSEFCGGILCSLYALLDGSNTPFTGNINFDENVSIGDSLDVINDISVGDNIIVQGNIFGGQGASAFFSMGSAIPDSVSNYFNNFNNFVGLRMTRTGTGTGDYLQLRNFTDSTLFTIQEDTNFTWNQDDRTSEIRPARGGSTGQAFEFRTNNIFQFFTDDVVRLDILNTEVNIRALLDLNGNSISSVNVLNVTQINVGNGATLNNRSLNWTVGNRFYNITAGGHFKFETNNRIQFITDNNVRFDIGDGGVDTNTFLSIDFNDKSAYGLDSVTTKELLPVGARIAFTANGGLNSGGTLSASTTTTEIRHSESAFTVSSVTWEDDSLMMTVASAGEANTIIMNDTSNTFSDLVFFEENVTIRNGERFTLLGANSAGIFFIDSFLGQLIIDLTSSTSSIPTIDLRPKDAQFGVIQRESDGAGVNAVANWFVIDASPDIMSFNFGVTDLNAFNIDGNDKVGIGAVSDGSKLFINGLDDVTQLKVQGHSIQNSPIFLVERSTGLDVFDVDRNGVFRVLLDNRCGMWGASQDYCLKYNSTGVFGVLEVGSLPRFWRGFSEYNFDNDVVIGNATGNFTVDQQGRIELKGSAKIHQHLSIQNANLGKGNTAPTQIIAGNYNGWEYNINDDSVLDIEFPHDLDASENISIHLSWFIDEPFSDNSGEVQWELNFSLTPHDESESILSPTNKGVVVSGDENIPAIANSLAHTTSLLILSGNLSSTEHDVMGVTIKRIAIDGGNNPSNDPTIIAVHLEYVSSILGTY